MPRRRRAPGAPALSTTESAAYKRANRHRWKSHGSDATHWRNVQARYGITHAEWELILAAQDGVCAICRRPPEAFSRRLCTDHIHSASFTEKHGKRATVRGLVCWRDNYYLIHKGITPDDLRRAADYLEKWPARKVFVDLAEVPMPVSDGDYRKAQRHPKKPSGSAGPLVD